MRQWPLVKSWKQCGPSTPSAADHGGEEADSRSLVRCAGETAIRIQATRSELSSEREDSPEEILQRIRGNEQIIHVGRVAQYSGSDAPCSRQSLESQDARA